MVMMKVQHFLWVSNIYSVRPKTLAMYPKATSPSICMLVATKVRVLRTEEMTPNTNPNTKFFRGSAPGPWYFALVSKVRSGGALRTPQCGGALAPALG